MTTTTLKCHVHLYIVLLNACEDSHCLKIILGLEIFEKPRTSRIELEIIRDGSLIVLPNLTLP